VAPDPYAGTLPATKFASPPAQTAMVPRRRLFDALDAAVQRPLTLVAAPPGAGKTALVGSWIAAGRAPGPVAWLSLDPADAERRRFWRAVLEALTRAGAGERIEALVAHPQERVELLAGALAAALADRAEPLVLVLDDFHDVADSVHSGVDLLLRHPPAGLRVVIATRADPPLHLGRLRLQDQLAEIRAPELALTLSETGEMLTALGISIGAEHVHRLWSHTEGWVGALRLAAMSLRDHADPERFVDDFAGDDRAISDYLLSEVMSTRSPDDRRFLLRTSVATVLNGELANALTDRTDGHRRLAQLARSGALLDPLDRRGEWYRYHALFGELLRAELRSEWPEQVPNLHRRAAAWLAEQGDDARGLLHAVQGEAWDLAARLAGERWVDLLIRGEIGALRPLIERLPPEAAAGDPELALAVAATLMDRGDERAAEVQLRRAEGDAASVPPERRTRFDASLAAVRLYVARLRGDLKTALAAGRTLDAQGGLEDDAIEADLRALTLANLGIAELWAGRVDAAGRHLERSRSAAAESGRDWIVLIALGHLAIQSVVDHDYPRAGRHARDAIALAERHGWERSWPAGAGFVALGAAEFLWDRLDDATATLARAQEALAGTRERPLRALLALVRAGVLNAGGDPDTALAVLSAGAEQLRGWPVMPKLAEQFIVVEALARAQLGNREQAQRLLGGATPSAAISVALAQLSLAGGEPDAARTELELWAGELEHDRSPTSIQGCLVDALALDALAEHDGAAVALELALDHTEPGGLLRLPIGFGRSVQPLLRRQLRRGTEHRALVGELLDALEDSNGRDHPPSALVIEPLSPRERAVLRYLPTMMSNQEIASELFVSVNTVKTHLKAIYRKLDVPDRRQAVRRARTLELLAP
jgi:LuxR family transcriptional regulator, maltose regulon positive regulatory protein